MMEPAPEMSTTRRAGRFVTDRPYRHAGNVMERNCCVTEPAKGVTPLPSNLRRYSLLLVLCLLIAWIASSMPFPYRFAVLPAGFASGIFVTLALVATIGVARVSMLRVLLAMGGVFSMMLTIAGAAWVVFAKESAEHDRCLRSAVTHQGELQCEKTYRDALESRYGISLP